MNVIRSITVALILLSASSAYAQQAEKPLPAGTEWCWDEHRQASYPCVPDHVDHLPLKLAIGAMFAGQAADLTSTMYCIGRGLCREANPLLEPLSDKPISLATVKMAVVSVEAFVIMRIHRTHPRAATWTAVAIAALGYGAAFHNRHQMQQAERGR